MPGYLAAVMVVNFLVDFLLLLGTHSLMECRLNWLRCFLAAFAGAIYSGLCLYPQAAFLGRLHWRVLFLLLMGMAVFGWNRRGCKYSVLFALLNFAAGGSAVLMTAGRYSEMILAAMGIFLLTAAFNRQSVGREFIPVEIRNGERMVQLTALKDTGNSLRDPLTGEQVLVVSARAARELTGLTQRQLASPMETLCSNHLPGMRLIPYHSIGCSSMMLAMRFPDVKLGNYQGAGIVAFAPCGLGEGESFQALTGGNA